MKRLASASFAAVLLIMGACSHHAAAHGTGGGHGQFRQGHESSSRHQHPGIEHRGFRQHEFEHRRFEGHHRFHGHSGVIVGVPFWAPPINYPPPLFIDQSPPVSIEPAANYWYYCPDPRGYYPSIQECPNGWLQVVPNNLPQ